MLSRIGFNRLKSQGYPQTPLPTYDGRAAWIRKQAASAFRQSPRPVLSAQKAPAPTAHSIAARTMKAIGWQALQSKVIHQIPTTGFPAPKLQESGAMPFAGAETGIPPPHIKQPKPRISLSEADSRSLTSDQQTLLQEFEDQWSEELTLPFNRERRLMELQVVADWLMEMNYPQGAWIMNAIAEKQQEPVWLQNGEAVEKYEALRDAIDKIRWELIQEFGKLNKAYGIMFSLSLDLDTGFVLHVKLDFNYPRKPPEDLVQALDFFFKSRFSVLIRTFKLSSGGDSADWRPLELQAMLSHRSLSRIHVLDLNGCRIRPDEIQSLNRSASSLPSVQELFLSNNYIGSAGRETPPFLGGLGNCPLLRQLTRLDLDRNFLIDGDVQVLFALKSLANLERLDLSRNELLTDESLAFLDRFSTPRLRRLDLDSEMMSIGGVAAILGDAEILPNLQELYFHGNNAHWELRGNPALGQQLKARGIEVFTRYIQNIPDIGDL